MADPTNFEKLQAFIEQIERDAYQRGWNDAAKSIVESATDAVKAAASRALSSTNLQETRRAMRGSVPPVVKTVLAEAGQAGVTAAEAYERAREHGLNTALASVRATLHRFVVKGDARKVGLRWFLAKTDDASPEQPSEAS